MSVSREGDSIETIGSLFTSTLAKCLEDSIIIICLLIITIQSSSQSSVCLVSFRFLRRLCNETECSLFLHLNKLARQNNNHNKQILTKKIFIVIIIQSNQLKLSNYTSNITIIVLTSATVLVVCNNIVPHHILHVQLLYLNTASSYTSSFSLLSPQICFSTC